MSRAVTKINSKMSETFSKRYNDNDTETLLQKILNWQAFVVAFYEEQKNVPWQSLIGPGPKDPTNFSLVHLWYIFILSFIPVCSFLSGLGFLKPYLASDSSLCDWRMTTESCNDVIVLFITYRIGFAVSIFFLFTTFLLITNSKRVIEEVSVLHTGFWIEKILMVLMLACVAFAFPPGMFDQVWLFVTMIGDFLVTCLEVFLLCDIVQDFQDKIRVFLHGKKSGKLIWRCVLLFFEILGPVSVIMSLSTLTIYNLFSKNLCLMLLIITFSNLVFILTFFLYIFCFRRGDILRSIYVAAYILYLVYKATDVELPLGTATHFNHTDWRRLVSLIISYTTLIYALLRKDQISHFYYFYWVLCRQPTDVDRSIVSYETIETASSRNKKGSFSGNLNETLLDLSFQKTKSDENSVNRDTERVNLHVKYLNICYSEAFVHAILMLVSLKTAALVSDFTYFSNYFNEISTGQPLIAVIAQQGNAIAGLSLYFWFLYSKNTTEFDPLWTAALVGSLAKNIGKLLHIIFVRVPSCFRKNTLSRYIYTIFYIFSFALSCTVLSPSFRRHFENSAFFCENIAPLGTCMSQDPSFLGLYRILASVGLFYFLLGILMVDIKPSQYYRDTLQNGCWLIKASILIAFFALFVNLPSKLSKLWLYISLLSTFMFTFIQLICLLDCISLIHGSCSPNDKPTPSAFYYSSTSLTTFLYITSTAAFICFYIYFAQNFNCKVTRLFVSINVVLCISASLVSIHPAVKNGGLLRSAIVTSYCMYLTWSALTYNPNEKCNPLEHSSHMIESRPTRDIVSIIDIFFMIITLIYYTARIELLVPIMKNLNPIRILACRCSHYYKQSKRKNSLDNQNDAVTLMNESYNSETNVDLIEKWLQECESMEGTAKHKSTKIILGLHDETYSRYSSMTEQVHDALPYSYIWFHTAYFIASSYSFILLSHWIEPVPGSAFRITVHWALMSVRMLASGCVVLVYIWTLINPFLIHLSNHDAI